MAQYLITKKLEEAGVTAAEVNAALATTAYNHPISELCDGDYARSSRDYDRVIAYLAKVVAEREQAAAAAAAEAPAEELATERQVAFILTLIDRRKRDGEAGGFVAIPTTREGVARLTKRQASGLIDSLTGRY